MTPHDKLLKFLSAKPINVWLDIVTMVNDPEKFTQLAKDCVDIGSLTANFNDDYTKIYIYETYS